MPLPSTATLGVAVAGRTVHVCLRRRSHYAYTAEPVRGTGAEGRREALRAACRRLDAGRPRVAMAVPESRVQRHRLRLPDGLRRSEHRAVLRLHVRRALPAPASAWRYCLGDERRRPRLLAARHTDLNAARALLYESGLRPVALLTSRDALARATGTPPAPLPDTPAARLTRALAEVARCPGPDNLLHARDPNARDNGHALRTAAGAAL
ncbi:MAG: pilus assembly protein PilM, partial [Halorhodospira halophila]